MTPWDRFACVAQGGRADKIPVALIVDSPWLPGFAGIRTLEYFLREDEWLRANAAPLQRFPDVTWIPGFWIEYGMAVEPSAFGARILWHADQPPSVEPVPGGLKALANIEPADPYQHGLMPLVLERYADANKRLLSEGQGSKIAAARGPFAVAAWLLGMSNFLVALKIEPEAAQRLLDVLTTTILSWLHAQLDLLRAPEGILLLDDMVGLLSPRLFDRFARPALGRIFDEFQGMVRIYHNDTPCPHLLERIASVGCDVFNFSHLTDIEEVQARMPGVALMGNVPPLDIMVRGTPEQVEDCVHDSLRKTGGSRLIVSAGGGMNAGTPAENIDALVRAAYE